MSVFWAMHHGVTARGAVQDAQGARRTAGEAHRKAAELEARCEKALLVCEALWTIIRDKLGVTEEELTERVNEIDLSDGKLDGKIRRAVAVFQKCKRKVASRFAKCLYCGHEMESSPFSA